MTSAGLALYVLAVASAAIAALAVAFAALTLVLRWRNARTARRKDALERRWERQLLDVLAGDAPPGSFGTLVAPRESNFFVGFVLRFARRLRGAEREACIGVAQAYLPRIARQLRSRSAEHRARAVQTLSALGAGAYGEEVRRALDDPAPLVAMVGARALARGRDPDHASAILRRLDRFDHWSPRYLASMLAGMGPLVAPILCDALADSARPPWVRAVAAEALGMLRDLYASDVAAAVLSGATDRELLAACLRLLGGLGRPAHVPRIRPLLKSGDSLVRAMAMRAVARLGGEEEVGLLWQGLDDPSPWVAVEAAEGIVAAGGEDILRAMAASDHPRAVLARQVLARTAA